ncbi:alpha-L-fucosidase [Flavihumibacter petaseus]|uniref:alpha-L-fucosidase n=1 Tax=Flavihumibacter petaseus NBRC 106054 TaxID=1220578 RepID=A0A0E9N5Z2_9BACT|nr:alpha-L-fucosidase [Flavihumibacter petaseus]GAO45244.1 putative alpha-L-fucosidase [Flavihumibacter petaseus NBRC 106054]
MNKSLQALLVTACLSTAHAVTGQTHSASHTSATTFQPTWESLDRKQVPEWFTEARFGIFIHWGVYSVPGWSSKGQYAEWYQNGLMNGDTARIRFHREKFGDRTYYDLANDFKAELFNADEWAKLFEASGAKYIVLTSKHHDGYCLWPNTNANQTWGFPWNAAVVGPKRDLIGELFSAVRKTSVHPGVYYSLYEWFNPLWKKDHAAYARDHAWPQMKELITKYQPEVLWTDGEWDASAETWKSREFLAWLYNESAVKDKIVTNDRWGSDIRFHHGMVYTPEYQPDLGFDNHAWEESRGMGMSYGYNREEDAWDYQTPTSLVMSLVDKVSRGGNFLLDIGPDEHGKIPPIMQERLLQMGQWMKTNGEAVYGCGAWRKNRQNDLYFTYNAKANDLFITFAKYPSGGKLVLENLAIPAGTEISLLGKRKPVSATQEGENAVLTLPAYDPNDFAAPYAYTVCIKNFGKFASKPVLQADYTKDPLSPRVSLTAPGPGEIRYTIDGSVPASTSTLYKAPFVLEKTTTVQAAVFQPELLPGTLLSEKVTRYEWMPARNPGKLAKGLKYIYTQPDVKADFQVILDAVPAAAGTAMSINNSYKKRKSNFGLVFEGFVDVPKNGIYNFYLTSDDGSRLMIDGVEIIDNGGEHGSLEKQGKAALKKGKHFIRILYFDCAGDNELKLTWQLPGQPKTEIPSNRLFHNAE